MVKLVEGPIYSANVYNSICSAFSGSVVFHYAIVKKQAGSGKATTSIEYRAAGESLQELEGVAVELERNFTLEDILLIRRIGSLGVGDIISLVAAGFGTERIPFMYNDFVIVGPAGDPAGVRGMKSATAALSKIAEKAAPFVSRGDKSGTHVAEMELWSKAGLKPSGTWYKIYEKGSEGNIPTLRFTSNAGSYTLIDRAT